MQDIKTGPSKENVTIPSWRLITPFALEAFSLPQKWSLIKHQSAGQEDILGQETYSSVYKIGARNLNIFIFEHSKLSNRADHDTMQLSHCLAYYNQ